jgi:hypothetical protein
MVPVLPSIAWMCVLPGDSFFLYFIHPGQLVLLHLTPFVLQA